MIISTRGRYALRVMVELAEHPTDGFTPLSDITEHLNISKEYLNSILKVLVQGGQLTSLRGKGGGYRLSYPPESYRIGTILRLVEGDLAPVSCVQVQGHCPNSCQCRSFGMWQELNKVINQYLDSVFLSDFLRGGRFYESRNTDLPTHGQGSAECF